METTNTFSEIDRIDKQLEKFENRLDKNEKCLQDTNIKLERNNVLTEQNNITMEKFSQTLEETSNTMREISYVIKQIVKNQDDMECCLSETNKKIENKFSEVDKRINCHEDKGKFDIIQYVQDNFPTICLTIFVVLDKVGVL